jgi:integrase
VATPLVAGELAGFSGVECVMRMEAADSMRTPRARNARLRPYTGKEIRALRQLRRTNLQSRFVFNTERGGPVARAWFLKMVLRTGELAKLPSIHPHMLRHGCGFKLANDGVDTRTLQQFLGQRNIMHTVRYTELRSDRFDGFWKD